MSDQQHLWGSKASYASDPIEEGLTTPKGFQIYTVSQLTGILKGLIANHPVVGGSVVVSGELSNVSRSSRGHVYFTLKDEQAAIKGVIWASVFERLSFTLEDGLAVYVTGQLEIYAPNGTYSLVAKKIEPIGIGALQLAYAQLKEKLTAEGLFDEDYKQPIPELPLKIGIVTAVTGAVIHDMLRVIRRKNPMVDVLLFPVSVQGDGAAQKIVQAVLEANDETYGLDVLIVGRGGGSFEDLFCFNEEPVVRAIFQSRVPIVTGIGHEPDYSLADAAADYSAATPTAAAEYVVPDFNDLVETFYWRRDTLVECIQQVVLTHEQRLDRQSSQLIRDFERQLEKAQQGLIQLQERFLSEGRQQFQRFDQYCDHMARALGQYNPRETLQRGYALVSKEDGSVVKSLTQVQPGENLRVQLADGLAAVQVLTIQAQQVIPHQ